MIAEATAQTRSADRTEQRERRGSSKAAAAEVLFPNATRKEPGMKSSPKLGKQLQKLVDSYNEQKFPETLTEATAILGNSAANEYDKALAAQLASQAAYQQDDVAASKRYLQQVLDALGAARVPAGKVYTAKDIAEDPHYRARDMLLTQQTRDGYSVEVPGIVPKLSGTPGTIRSSAPHLGDDTDAVLADAGLTAEQIALLRSKGVIQ